ncbi:hypothetical protein PIB30_005736 [Stylosanthes scabra]|uniref:Transposase (Putative), gypsy type n=1 Tax=Stylosanthes scabra TaxID=79078 RepID=A0ABU6V6N7_9FABA|nr:hypothetical protein [Stylosanthes scabra]
MGKKKSCQNVRVPRLLNAVERGLYGWVEETIFTQPSVLEDSLPELRRRTSLTENAAAEGDFILEAARPLDRLPFQASEGDPHFLWVYQELFTCLVVRLPFTDFQKEVMMRCRVAVSQLHLNGWGLLRTFERACLHFGRVRGVSCLAFLRSPSRSLNGIILQFCLLLVAMHFGWMMGGRPFPWVYWNRGVKDFVVHELDPLEMTVFDFLVSLPAGLPKKNNLTCRWILDNNDAVVGRFLDDLLLVEMKKTKLDRMMAMMADPTRMAPRSVLPAGVPAATAAAAAATSAAPAESSANPATPSVQVPLPPFANSRAMKSSSKKECPEVVNVAGEEGAKEDPDADLRQKRRRKEKGKWEDLMDRVLGDDAAWEHAVNPLDLAFPKKYNYQKALDAGLTSSSMRKHLEGMLPDQLLGESWRLSCHSLAFLQIGLESVLKAKTKAEEELLTAKDQLSVLKVERDSALEYLPLKEKADSLAQQLSQKEVEHRSAIERVAQLDEDIKDQKRAESAESNSKALAASLETAQAELAKARDEANYWCTEWKSLGTEAKEMCQETLEIGRRIHVPNELLGDDAEVAEIPAEEGMGQQQQPEQGGVSGECPT